MTEHRELTRREIGGRKAAVDIYSLRLRPISTRLVREYAEGLAGAVFAAAAPVLVYETEKGAVLVDGFHRMTAFRRWQDYGPGGPAPRAIRAEVRRGTYAEAVVASATANLAHGERPNRKARWATILRLRWQDDRYWSYNRLAEAVGMGRSSVQYVVELDRDVPHEPRREGRDGLVFGSQRRLTEIQQDTSSDEYKRVLEIKRWQQAQAAEAARIRAPSEEGANEALAEVAALATAVSRMRAVPAGYVAQVLVGQDAARWGSLEPRPRRHRAGRWRTG